MKKPMFITLEGIDGSGKSTQMQRLAARLQEAGETVVVTRDPGGTPLGQKLRHILLHHDGFIAPHTELFLYLADRAQHVAELIRPALDEGKVVLCDRYLDSTFAYQGGGRGFPLKEIASLNELATGGLMPDRTLLFDGPVDLLLGRANHRGQADRLEQETHDFYERVRRQYLALAQADPNRIKVLNATLPLDDLEQAVQAALESVFSP
jgi:dTMP kinase